MRKLLLPILFLLTFSFTSNAQILMEENFDYTAGDTLITHGWVAHSAATTNAILVTTPGLTYPGYPSVEGNAVSISSSGQDVNYSFIPETGGDLYASFLVNVTSATSTGDYFFHFTHSDIGTFIYMGRTYVKQAGNGNLAFGLSKSSTSSTIPAVYGDSIFTTGTTYVVVLKYTFSPGVNDDTVKLFINPDLTGAEPEPYITHALSSNDDPSDLGRVAIRQGGGSSAAALTLDGIRVSKTWSEAVPVELTSFSANVVKGNVQLNWSTSTETNNRGFNIERKADGKKWSNIGYVPGSGTTTQSRTYSYSDKNLSNGKYQYRLKQVDFDGTYSYSSVAEVNVSSSITYELSQNYPNPFNPTTTIKFSLPEAGYVTLKVYNMLGQEIKTLINGFREAGIHNVEFHADDLFSGLYLYKIEVGNFSQVKKMTLLK